MAKRKKTSKFPKINYIQWGAVTVIVLIGVFFAFQGVRMFLTQSDMFNVKDFQIVSEIDRGQFPELDSFKGENVFKVNLKHLETRLRLRYPRIGGIRVLRHLPDQLSLSGYMRQPIALTEVSGNTRLLSRDGYVVATVTEGHDNLPFVLGLKGRVVSLGAKIHDPHFDFVLQATDIVAKDPILSDLEWRSIDIEDPVRLSAVFKKDGFLIKVFLDEKGLTPQLEVLSTMLSKAGLNLASVDYIDLRFDEPVIGEKRSFR